MSEHNIAPIFGSVKRIGPARWELDYIPKPGQSAHFEWDHEPTDDELAALRAAPLPDFHPLGEEIVEHRYLLGPIRVRWFKDVGPPRWWVPRCYPIVGRHGVGWRWGWRFTAHEVFVSRRRTKTSNRSVTE